MTCEAFCGHPATSSPPALRRADLRNSDHFQVSTLAFINPLLLTCFGQRESDMALYAQTSGSHQTTSPVFTDFAGLSITLPEGVGTMGIVTLNVPLPYATGNDNPGGTFGISINGTTSPVIAGFTYNEKQPPAFGRIPTTLVVGVPLGPKPQVIKALWQNVRGSNVHIDSPATLSAILA
jgi:hypothetical protein